MPKEFEGNTQKKLGRMQFIGDKIEVVYLKWMQTRSYLKLQLEIYS